MSHFTVLVIGDDVEGQLAPYDENIEVEPYRKYADTKDLEWYYELYARENDGAEPADLEALTQFLNRLDGYGENEQERYHYEPQGGIYQLSTYNPKSKWDWYSVGGRWTGYFEIKEGVPHERTKIGEPGLMTERAPAGTADQIRKCDWDIESTRDEAGERAAEKWDQAQVLFADLPAVRPWREILADHADEQGNHSNEALAAAREAYQAQERVRAVDAHDTKCRREDRWEDCLLGLMGDGVERYQVSREVFIHEARDRAISTYAYVHNGEWYAPGKMGWWGISDETPATQSAYNRKFNELIDSLPDDTLFTLVDCHI